VSWICHKCGIVYGDRLYKGPAGHAPRDWCYDCWLAHRVELRRMSVYGRKELLLRSAGHTQAEAARILGIHQATVARRENLVSLPRDRRSVLPPGLTDDDIGRIPAEHREDAIQEAWVAYLEAQRSGEDGFDARRAVWRYVQRERRHNRREINTSSLSTSDTSVSLGFGKRRLSRR